MGATSTRGDGTITQAQYQAILDRLDTLEEDRTTLQSDVSTLQTAINNKASRYTYKSYSNLTIPAKDTTNNKSGKLTIDTITFDHDCLISISAWAQHNASGSAQVDIALGHLRGNTAVEFPWNGAGNTAAGALTHSTIFNIKAGDIIQFAIWNWNTATIPVPSASLTYYEL